MSSDKDYYFLNKSKGTYLATNARIAKSFFARAKGLLGTSELPKGEGLHINPCNSIHMFGMKYAIDAVFLDKKLKVVAVVDSIAPGKASRLYGSAHSCLELPAGTARKTNTEVGDELEFGNAKVEDQR
jgi:Uncharacterized conserved protein